MNEIRFLGPGPLAALSSGMPGLTVPFPTLSTEGLMTRGFFPDRSIPSVNSVAIAPALPHIGAFLGPTETDVLARKRVKFRSLKTKTPAQITFNSQSASPISARKRNLDKLERAAKFLREFAACSERTCRSK
jgi:hypothetical protein